MNVALYSSTIELLTRHMRDDRSSLWSGVRLAALDTWLRWFMALIAVQEDFERL